MPDFRLLACSHPFSFTGVDIFGPFQVFEKFTQTDRKPTKLLKKKKFSKPKTSPPYKTWILIFTCLSTRAIYLISINNLDTREIWTAFLTFFSDRGTPQVLLSDNAAQFTLISQYLPEFWINFTKEEAIADKLTSIPIQ